MPTQLSKLMLTEEQLEAARAADEARSKRAAGIEEKVAVSDPAKPTRDELHALLDACLDLEALNAEEPLHRRQQGYGSAIPAGLRLARALATGAFGWTSLQQPLTMWWKTSDAAWRELALMPKSWRYEVAWCLQRTPGVLPLAMVEALVAALIALNEGERLHRICWSLVRSEDGD